MDEIERLLQEHPKTTYLQIGECRISWDPDSNKYKVEGPVAGITPSVWVSENNFYNVVVTLLEVAEG